MDRTIGAGRAVLAALAVSALAMGASAAQEAGSLQAHFGEKTYQLFCVGCHGPDGRGNPPVARALQMPLVDLTGIARDNGGSFDADAVADAILGNDGMGHGRVRMAPWARVFADEFEAFKAEAIVNEMVDRRIDHLVSYIESIQER